MQYCKNEGNFHQRYMITSFDKLSFLSVKAQERVNYPEENSVMQKKFHKLINYLPV